MEALIDLINEGIDLWSDLSGRSKIILFFVLYFLIGFIHHHSIMIRARSCKKRFDKIPAREYDVLWDDGQIWNCFWLSTLALPCMIVIMWGLAILSIVAWPAILVMRFLMGMTVDNIYNPFEFAKECFFLGFSNAKSFDIKYDDKTTRNNIVIASERTLRFSDGPNDPYD